MNNPPDFIRQFWRKVWRWIIRFRKPGYSRPLPPEKKSEKGCLWGRGRLCTGQSQTDNPFLALVWKQLITKFPCPVFLMIAKDFTERPSAVALSKVLLLRAANAFRVTWSERIFFSDTPPKCLHRDCAGRRRTGTGLGNVYLSVSEKQGIVTGNYCLSATCFRPRPHVSGDFCIRMQKYGCGYGYKNICVHT